MSTNRQTLRVSAGAHHQAPQPCHRASAAWRREAATMKLIVNADDFGLCPGVNRGIIDAFLHGIVRSTSIMPGGAAYREAVELAKGHPGLGVGIHLTLTSGKPLTGGPSTLTRPDGGFYAVKELEQRQGELDPGELEQELEAQIQRVKEDGISPTHLDSHHHVHLLAPVLPVVLGLARRHKLPVRLRSRSQLPLGWEDILCPDSFVEGFHGDFLNIQRLSYLLTAHLDRCGVVELMCHPGYVDSYLLEHSSYSLPRATELELLTGEAARHCVEYHYIQLVNYRELTKNSGDIVAE